MFAREQASRPDAHQRHARVIAVARVADHVTVTAFDLEHHRRLFHALEMLKGVSQLGCALEIQ